MFVEGVVDVDLPFRTVDLHAVHKCAEGDILGHLLRGMIEPIQDCLHGQRLGFVLLFFSQPELKLCFASLQLLYAVFPSRGSEALLNGIPDAGERIVYALYFLLDPGGLVFGFRLEFTARPHGACDPLARTLLSDGLERHVVDQILDQLFSD
ncbi:hypothetical protein [uncultured Collinsella sp.]|uniref:hypothetical protein n=1 Tax=uncultured Collinsella sp. TaxID=165190 RepID=UPI0026721B9D|nr:hypothetical protein [uncultured Collinsella sp.]